MKSRILLLRALPLLLLISPATHAAEEAPAPTPSTAKVVDLRVESQTNPTALNTPLPRFSWRIEKSKLLAAGQPTSGMELHPPPPPRPHGHRLGGLRRLWHALLAGLHQQPAAISPLDYQGV